MAFLRRLSSRELSLKYYFRYQIEDLPYKHILGHAIISLPSGDGWCGLSNISFHGCAFGKSGGKPSPLTVSKNEATGSGSGPKSGYSSGLESFTASISCAERSRDCCRERSNVSLPLKHIAWLTYAGRFWTSGVWIARSLLDSLLIFRAIWKWGGGLFRVHFLRLLVNSFRFEILGW